MIRRWLGLDRPKVTVTILGVVGGRMVQYTGEVRAATVEAALRAAGRVAGADLIAALEKGDQPAVMLDGERLDLPGDLSKPLHNQARLSWLMPMAGG